MSDGKIAIKEWIEFFSEVVHVRLIITGYRIRIFLVTKNIRKKIFFAVEYNMV